MAVCARPPLTVIPEVGQWWPVQDAVPYASEEEWTQGSETIDLFLTFPWLKPPKGGPPSPNRREVASGRAEAADFDYDFTIHDLEGRQILENLRRWYRPQAGVVPSEQLAQGLSNFAKEALKAFGSGRLSPTGEDGKQLLPNAIGLMKAMTQQGFISISRGDLNVILQAFLYDPLSRTWSPKQLDWWAGSMKKLIEAILDKSSEEQQNTWKATVRRQLADEESALYTTVDARAWPSLRSLVDGEHTELQRASLCRRIRVQLCAHGSLPHEKLQDLEQAAKIIRDLNLYRDFNPEGSSDHEICQTFNDRTLSLDRRTDLVEQVLTDAPRRLVREVLRKMDEDLDENERYEDRPLRSLQRLLFNLDEDIRTCPKAYLKLMRTWIRNVVEHEELTPDQICEHIESDDNYEVLLRDAVNYLVKENRTFEAAKMLARPKGQVSRSRESLRNDQQIFYLVNLYKIASEPADHFGPVAEGTMALPQLQLHQLPGPGVGSAEEDKGYHELRKLLDTETPRAIGLWWLWRCFDGYHDKHARAALVVITLEDRFFIVDILELELKTSLHSETPFDEPYLDLIKQIVEARHLLKVVHYLEGTALRALQLALISQKQRNGDAKPSSYCSISPTIDVALATAYLSGSSGRQSKELPSLVWKYLRQDLDVTEALSNFELRPLRQSQQHYAVCLAWCPMAILRACCSHALVPPHVAKQLIFRADGGWVEKRMDEAMHRQNFGEGGSNFPPAAGVGLEEVDSVACNIWEEPKEQVPWTGGWAEELRRKANDKASNSIKYEIRNCAGQVLRERSRGELLETPNAAEFPLEVRMESQAVRKLKLDESASQTSAQAVAYLCGQFEQKSCLPPRWKELPGFQELIGSLYQKNLSDWELQALYQRQAEYRPPWRR